MPWLLIHTTIKLALISHRCADSSAWPLIGWDLDNGHVVCNKPGCSVQACTWLYVSEIQHLNQYCMHTSMNTMQSTYFEVLANPTGFPGGLPGNHVATVLLPSVKAGFTSFLPSCSRKTPILKPKHSN